MLHLFLHAANGLTALPFAVSIRWDGALGYWRGQIYRWRGCCLFIEVILMEGAN